jgi:hypothetical protein
MARRNRLMTLLALLVFVPFIAACGPADEPVVEAPAAEETPVEQPVEQAPMEEPQEQEPQAPQLVGNITLTGENFDWGETNNEEAGYNWTVRVANDTTAALDITVRFQFLDDSDSVIKTETKTVRLQPATSTTVREGGRMTWDDANRVYSFSATYDYSIVTG